jgi:phosphoribosylformylglycinamidine cyclo-ligase
MAHITGGGLTDNIPRVLAEGTSAKVLLGSWSVPDLFRYLQKKGEILEGEMLRTFNVGIGMVVMVAREHLEETKEFLSQVGENAVVIGEIIEGDREVVYGGSL